MAPAYFYNYPDSILVELSDFVLLSVGFQPIAILINWNVS